MSSIINFTIFKGDKGGRIVADSVQKELKPHDIVIKITHSGLCFTDHHYKTTGYALGHEGVGIVERVGSDVTTFRTGDHAGWGFTRDSCRTCDMCLEGEDIYCDKREIYGRSNFDQGSLASHTIVNELFAHKIPSEIALAHAGPLMCAGATVFEAMRNIQSTDLVGIIGIGGLGHLAIQFAANMGCEVVVFSGSNSKKEEAIKLGATEFYAMRGVEKLELKDGKKVKHLLVTTSATPDWNIYLPILAKKGTIFPLTAGGKLDVPTSGVNLGGTRIQGSLVSSRPTFRRMLKFAAVHGIKPMTNEFPMTPDGIEAAFDALEHGKLRYRAVLVAQG